MKITKILMLITFTLLLSISTAFAIEGEGTEESPFLISNEDELRTISDFSDCHFKLTNDIECSKYWDFNITFTGTFDGNNFNINFSGMGRSFLYTNKGVIKNTKFSVESCSGNGIISSNNHGKIVNCITYGKTSGGSSIASLNGENGVIHNCANYANVSESKSGGNYHNITSDTYAYAAALVKYNYGNITNSYAICNVSASASSYYYFAYAYACGFVYKNTGNISNCYAVTNIESKKKEGYGSYVSSYSSAFTYSNEGTMNDCFYERNTSSSTSSNSGVTAKTPLAMKMKKTYTDAGWDFENVWGIDADINDGYPYLLWEYPDNSSANTEIIGATSTDNTLKFISEVSIEGEPEISTFGTFILIFSVFFPLMKTFILCVILPKSRKAPSASASHQKLAR